MATLKTCFKCLQTKELAEFYKHAQMGDRHLNKCKECTKKDVARHRQANLELVRGYDKMRATMPHRVAARKEYAHTPAGRLAHARALRKQRAKYPDRYQARLKLGNAIRDGKVIPWPICAVPDCCEKPQAHHPDYSRPLDVVWLCDAHHKQAHKIAA